MTCELQCPSSSFPPPTRPSAPQTPAPLAIASIAIWTKCWFAFSNTQHSGQFRWRCGKSDRQTETVPFFFLHTFLRGPVIFSIESHSFVCLELVLKLHSQNFQASRITRHSHTTHVTPVNTKRDGEPSRTGMTPSNTRGGERLPPARRDRGTIRGIGHCL